MSMSLRFFLVFPFFLSSFISLSCSIAAISVIKFKTMFPVTVVKRFLNRNVPNIPLPPDIDDNLDSASDSWILVSKPTSSSRSQTGPTTNSVACQTKTERPLPQASPRSRRRDYTPHDQALPPPKFRMKSKPPIFHVGGLDAPVLQPFTSSTSSKRTTADPPVLKILQASAKHLPSPSSIIRPELHNLLKPRNQWNQTEPRISSRQSIFYEINFSSKLFCEIHDSQFAEQHIERIGDSLGTGGLLMYLQVWQHWACWCHFHSTIPAEAPSSLILDYLHASDLFKKKKNSEPSRTRMTTHIKALVGLHLNLTFPYLTLFRVKQSLIFLNQRLESLLKDPKLLPYHWPFSEHGSTASPAKAPNQLR